MSFLSKLGISARANAVTISKLRASKDWATEKSDDRSYPFIVTTRKPIGAPQDKEGFEGFMSLQFEYAPEGSECIPEQKELALFNGWTQAFQENFDSEDTIFLSAMASGGLCQWIFITRNPAAAYESIGNATSSNAATKEHFGDQKFTHMIETFHDPEWEQIKTYLRAFEK